jgi:hypothetical protein
MIRLLFHYRLVFANHAISYEFPTSFFLKVSNRHLSLRHNSKFENVEQSKSNKHGRRHYYPGKLFALIFASLYVFWTTRNKERLALIEKGADPTPF